MPRLVWDGFVDGKSTGYPVENVWRYLRDLSGAHPLVEQEKRVRPAGDAMLVEAVPGDLEQFALLGLAEKVSVGQTFFEAEVIMVYCTLIGTANLFEKLTYPFIFAIISG